MPVLADPFREAFCQFIAAGEKQADALLKARMHTGKDSAARHPAVLLP